MSNPVIWEVFVWIIGPLLAFIAANWVHTYKADQKLHARISGQGRRLDDYRLEVSEKYASVVHLKEVEDRLIDAIKGLREDIKDLTGALLENVADEKKQNGGRARKGRK